MTVKKLTPVLIVDAIEKCLDFWAVLGFSKTVEVPHGDKLGFVILVKDGIEIMYQTRASAAEDVPAVASGGAAFIFIEVDDVDAIDRVLKGHDYVMPRRTTFYGADEVIVREPGGNVVTFAQMKGNA